MAVELEAEFAQEQIAQRRFEQSDVGQHPAPVQVPLPGPVRAELADRFVFINMNKHREGARIEAGPVIKEITPDGVILQHQGQTFLLPRE
jgi:hypothetical protein